jgi:predicted RNA-binding protein with PIN domain
VILVDGMNVIGSRPDGWWRDRKGAAQKLARRLQLLAAETGEPVILVLDGRPTTGLPEGSNEGIDVQYARRPGRDAGDDRLVEIVAALEDRSDVRVVTSDRGLAARVGALGVPVLGAGWLLDRLDSLSRS